MNKRVCIEAVVANITDAVCGDQPATNDELARCVDAPGSELTLNEPPLLTRKEKQARKGLPTPENLRKLAKVWLETARELWPELVHAGLLPAPTNDVIDQLVRDFERRFISGQPEEYRPTLSQRFWSALVAGYVRYSDNNSNPRSLDDQIVKELRRAKIDGRFIPWEYVFADASVTGRTHLRRGDYAFSISQTPRRRFLSS
jgi:hypothetical protein